MQSKLHNNCDGSLGERSILQCQLQAAAGDNSYYYNTNKNGICKALNNVETLGKKLNTLSMKVLPPTTTVSACSVLGRIQLVLSLQPTTPGVEAEGGVQGILIVMYSFISMSKRSVHACPTKGVRTYVSWEQESMHSGAFGSRTILF